jgi:hypothetical protein
VDDDGVDVGHPGATARYDDDRIGDATEDCRYAIDHPRAAEIDERLVAAHAARAAACEDDAAQRYGRRVHDLDGSTWPGEEAGMAANDTTATERAWLEGVSGRLATATGRAAPAVPSDADVRALLRVTKITADVTGVRYLAPLTAYLIGRAAGDDPGFDLKATVEQISRLAEGWAPQEG